MMDVRFATGKEELDRLVDLRYRILRAPWGQPAQSARDELEKTSYNAYIELNGEVVACGRLQMTDGQMGQIRYMAVSEKYRGQHLGSAILTALEEKARELGLRNIMLQARENAVGFYQQKGYTIKEKTFRLWDIIQHFRMEKEIQDPVSS